MSSEKKCMKCKTGETARNILISCENEDCQVFIHDQCIGNGEGEIFQGKLVWRCIEHLVQKVYEDEAKAKEREQSTPQEGLINVNVDVSTLSNVENLDELLSFVNEKASNRNSCAICKAEKLDLLLNCIGCQLYFHKGCISKHVIHDELTKTFTCDNCFNIRKRILEAESSRDKDVATHVDRDFHVNFRRRTTRFVENSQRIENIGSENTRTSYNSRPQASSPRRSVPQTRFFNRQSTYSPISNQTRHTTAYSNRTSSENLNESCVIMLEKMALRELPVVNDSNLSWITFYETYRNTKDMFLDYENIVRIKKAILDEEVLQIGGTNLFNIRTYDATIEKINKRLYRNLSFVNTEANNLQRVAKLRVDNHKKIIEFIDRVVNFSNLAYAYNESSYTSNKIFINSLSEKLPTFLHNKWIAKQCSIESQGLNLKLQHLVDVLEEELPNIATRYHNSLLPSYDEGKVKFEKQHRVNNVEDDRTIRKKFNFDGKSCWFHKSDSHPSNKCKVLWGKSGIEVVEMARKQNRCVICGQINHFPCPFKERLECREEGCKMKHYQLYCHKRKGKSESNQRHNNILVENDVELEYDEDEIEAIANEMNSSTVEENSVPSTNMTQRESRKFFTNGRALTQNTVSHLCSSPYLNLHTVSENSTKLHSHKEESFVISRSSPTLLGVVVIRLENKLDAAFLVDSGSTVSLLEESIANKLQLYGPNFPLSLSWTGEQKRNDEDSRIVRINVSRTDKTQKNYILYFRTMYNLKICRQKLIAKDIKAKYPHLRSLDLVDYNEIAGIIGIDNIWVFNNQVIKAKNHENSMPLGIKCPIGDYVMGTQYPLEMVYMDLNEGINSSFYQNSYNYAIDLLSEDERKELEEMERNVIKLENINPLENERESYEDKLALDTLEKQVKKIHGTNQFEAPLLWRDENIILPTEDSFRLAVRRYYIVEKLAKVNNRFQECELQIKNLLEKKYAVELSDQQIANTSDKTFYVPIFFIYPHGKRNRMIWDMAAKVNGRSINDELLSGPNLYNELLSILFQMSENKVMVKGDLKEMFHQVKLIERDTDSIRFVFRFEGDTKLRVFKMLVLPFGAKCSPTISQYVKNLLAKEHETSNSVASDIIRKNTYVDDVIISVDKEDTAVDIIHDVRKILLNGGFSLLKINSNKRAVLDVLKNKLDQAKNLDENLFSTEVEEKILGYKINLKNDKILLALSLDKFDKNLISGKEIPTKRNVLQVLMSIFDPIGFFQFVTSKIKLLYKKICISKCDWNELIPENLMNEWRINLKRLEQIRNVEIPRSYCDKNYEFLEIWAFGDAGKDILCGVIYARYLDKNKKQVGVRLIYAKTFIVPQLPTRTIPELELQIALDLCKMVKKVLETHKTIVHEIKMFTDNSAVYEWIKNGPKNPTTYVRNRVKKINELSEKSMWNWISTDFMVADFGTKESSMPEITYENEWFHPKLFSTPERDWPSFIPSQSVSNYHELDEKGKNNVDILDFHKFSSFQSMIYVIQFCYRLKKLIEIKKLKLEVEDLRKRKLAEPRNKEIREKFKTLEQLILTENNNMKKISFMYENIEFLLIKKCQKEAFCTEYELLAKKLSLPKNNYYYRFSPFLDQHGVIRLCTRLVNDKKNRKLFGYDRIFPILLPKEHALTDLIVLKFHKTNKHMLDKNTVNLIRTRFFIRHIKHLVRKVIKAKCAFCIRYNVKPEVPLMGDLPSVRLGCFVPPFSFTMSDIAGPILVKMGRNNLVKRYIFVYSCLTTRALHLELIENLDSESTLLALQSVINLRGAPIRIITDNGTNFTGAKNKMHQVVNEWNKKLLSKGYIINPIEWDFGPARAPHMQGSVERMIRLVKGALNKMIAMIKSRTENLTDFTLRAMLTEIVGLLNNRPLAFDSQYDTENEFLTPNSFLMYRSNFQEVPFRDEKIRSLNKNWEDVRKMTAILWNHWIKAYLPTILEREKWEDKKDPLRKGDLVITVDTTVSNSWRLGRILEVKEGSKDQVRQVEIVLGKRNNLDKLDVKCEKSLLKAYKNEKFSIVTRPAIAVAKIRV